MNKLKSYAFFYNYKETFSHKNVSTLHLLTKIYNLEYNSFNDRFNILLDDAEYNMLSRCDDIEQIWNSDTYSFEECCRIRTDDIINIAKDRDIYIAYSGGVDSSCIVCAFLMNERLDKNKFFVVCNQFAIDEYPYLYELLLRNKVNVIHIKSDISEIVNLTKNDVIFVNGNCGDQLDGSVIPQKRFPDINFYTPWQDAIVEMSKRRNIAISDKHIFDIERYSNIIGARLKTAGDFGWLFNFSLKYNYVTEYMTCLSLRPDNMITFFDTQYFQKYGLLNHNMNRDRKHQHISFLYKNHSKNQNR